MSRLPPILLAIPLALSLGCSGGTKSGSDSDPAAASDTPQQTRTTVSGIRIETLREGTGRTPRATDRVRVHYHGTFPDGEVFDSSVQRGEPAEFPLNGVIPCWTEAVQTMKEGGKIRITCPPGLAYGARGAGPIPPDATLIFEIDLLQVL